MSETVTEQPAEAPDDIRSAVAAAFDAAEAPAAESAEQPERTERPRDEAGRFTKAQEGEQPPEKPAEQPAAPAAPAEPEKAPEHPKTTEPPANWAAADKETFKGLPPNAQEFLLRRHAAMEADYTKKTQEIAAFRRDYEPISQMLSPYREAMGAKGFTPATLIQSWMNVEKQLLEGRGADIIRGLVDGYQIDRAAVARALGLVRSDAPQQPDAPKPEGAQPQLPPEVVQRLTGVERYIQQQQIDQQARAAAEQRVAEQRVMSEIEQFASEKDASGALLHPHFQAVESDMTRLAIAVRASGGTPKLSELYEQAVWANPSTRDALLASQRAADEAQRAKAEETRRAEARAKAEQAKRAASSVTGAPSQGTPGRREPQSLREELSAAFDEREAA